MCTEYFNKGSLIININLHQLLCKFVLYFILKQDLSKMQIGTAHRNKIWKELVNFRNGEISAFTDSQGIPRDISLASTISMSSQNSMSQNSNYNPGYYEVTRYTFKHTISVAADNKDSVSYGETRPKRECLE